MKKKRSELKAKMMAEAEEVIDELLDWHEATEAPSLSQIEEVVLQLRKRMSAEMTNAVLEDQEKKRPVPGPECPECGQEMHYKGMKKTRVEGRAGTIEVERGYYYCDRCRRGLFPPR